MYRSIYFNQWIISLHAFLSHLPSSLFYHSSSLLVLLWRCSRSTFIEGQLGLTACYFHETQSHCSNMFLCPQSRGQQECAHDSTRVLADCYAPLEHWVMELAVLFFVFMKPVPSLQNWWLRWMRRRWNMRCDTFHNAKGVHCYTKKYVLVFSENRV